MRFTIGLVLLMYTAAVSAAAGVRVPDECDVLRRYKGLPRVVSEAKADELWQELNRYASDPRVVGCRNAVARLRVRR